MHEITEHVPRATSRSGTAGLLRPVGTYTVDPIGESAHMNAELDQRSRHRQAVVPLALRQAAKQSDHEKFKELLESGVVGAAST